MSYLVLDDYQENYRSGFIIPESELNQYSLDQYFVVRNTAFATKDIAEEFVSAYNEYELDDDPDFIECKCCSQGCFMSAFDWAHWDGTCQFDKQ